MAKPKACPKCGKWYNPRFSGTEEMCAFCFIKERISEPKEELDDKQKVKIETEQPVIATKPRTTLRPATKNAVFEDEEFLGTCSKCGLQVVGSEIYHSELGWIFSWAHQNADRTRASVCLVA